MYFTIAREDRPSLSDLVDYVDEDLHEEEFPLSIEEEEMAPADPALYESPTIRQANYLRRLYRLGA